MASSSASCSSSIFSTSRWMYDVFLSFSGEDTRNTATDFIYFALEQKGIYTFKDDKKLEKGKPIEPELFKAIKESRFAVVILSRNYASSTWCLNELVEIVACEKLGMTILPIFYNVDPSDVRKQQGTFAQPFDEYEKQFEETVGTWRDALKHAANIAGFHVDNRPLSEVVKSIVSLISRNSSCTFSEVTEGLVGIDSQVVELWSCLALGLDDDVRFIGIWAMGGMGKTTLARVVYKMVSEEFEACCIIYNVREKCETVGGLLPLQKYLISQTSKESNLNIEDFYDGVHMIKKRLSHRRILLVLDDVNKLDQLEYLAGKRDWFGQGSRIIITTRDKHLLETHLETHLKDKIYEVKALETEDALHLFRSKAFKNELVPDEYLELSKGFLNYVAGHPFALIVLGSFLCKRSVAEWENEFEKLNERPKLDVIRVLKISYDGLEELEKEIFKDIACFFDHEKKDYVVKIQEILGRYPHSGLSILIEKSLLKISYDNGLWMHDLLRDMGRDIVRQESLEPGRRSRLWHYQDIDNVLKNDTGTEIVQAVDIRGAEYTSFYHEEKEACWRSQCLAPLVALQGWVLSALSWQGLALLVTHWRWVQRTLSWQGFTSSKKPEGLLWNPNAFLKMPNLKFLRIHSISLPLDTSPLPNNLSYLECNDYPLKSLHSLPAGLVELCMPRSKIELLWRGMKIFENLKSINMDGSSGLIISPNFNGVQNLEELVLARCSNLRQLHLSIGKLKKLRLLDLKGCQELTSLPDKFEMESLVTLDLTHCLKVKKIPEFVGNMELLQELLLEGTAIIELPSSVECLTGLNTLILQNCKNLVCLPNFIFSLSSLNNLNLSGCSKFDKLSKDLGNTISLKNLDLSGTAIKELPSSVECLTGLNTLILQNCKNLVCLPNIICSLTSLNDLNLFGCSEFDKLPKDLGNIISLKKLDLSGTAIKELPSSVKFLTGLEALALEDCKKFVLLPSTVCSLKSLRSMNLSRCRKFVILPENLGNLKHLVGLYLGGTAIEVLPSSVGHLADLIYLNLKDCKNLLCLPSTVCNLKGVHCLNLAGCSKITNLPENLGNMESLDDFSLGGTAITELPSSIIHLKPVLSILFFRGCQLSSSSLTSMPGGRYLDLSGSDFVSLPESFSQLSGLRRLYLDGCKSLRSLSNIQIPSSVYFVCVDNCTSLERLPECREPTEDSSQNITFQCFNCLKLAENFENISNMFQGQSSPQLNIFCIIPGREIPKWFEKVNICDTSDADTSDAFRNYFLEPRTYKRKKGKIQLPGSGSGCDEWWGIVLCVVFLPPERRRRYQVDDRYLYHQRGGYWQPVYDIEVELVIRSRCYCWMSPMPEFTSEYEVESHHLWLRSLSLNGFCLPKTPGRSIVKKGFHQVGLEIRTRCLEVEKIGFRVV